MYSQFRAIESMLEDCSMRKQTLSNVNKTIMTYLSKVPMKLTSRYKDLSTIDWLKVLKTYLVIYLCSGSV